VLDRHHRQGRFAYSGNAGAASVTGLLADVDGALTILEKTARRARPSSASPISP
jgi:hypothetical protein